MKKDMHRLLLAFALVAGGVSVSHAQVIYVKVEPVDPVVVRPAQPSPAHVWIGGEYIVHGNGYQWRDGYWAVPPAGRREWIRGSWASKSRGHYYWRAGYWK